METISYLNIKVEGFPFQKVRSLSIRHVPNEHAMAKVVGEADTQTVQDSLQRLDERSIILITAAAEGQPKKLFCGIIAATSLQQDNAYSLVTLELCSTSRLTDVVKKNKTYQNTAATYEKTIGGNIEDIADVHMMVSDRAIGALVMQYGETDWEFAKRMASRLDAPLTANLFSERSQIYVGLPPACRRVSEDTAFFDYGSDTEGLAGSPGAMAEDFSGETVRSYAYAYLGDEVLFNGRVRNFKSVEASLEDGILQMKYGLLGGGGGGTGGTGSRFAGIAVPKTANAQASGKMMKGRVQAVQGDKVQVFLTSVDKEYDTGGNWWFPYSTTYSSSDGSGWYCMPEEEDEVLVFFPSGEEGEAFAASSVCASPPSNPHNKSWKAPGGKEILLTDEGMYIIGKSGKIFINLTDEDGIDIHSDKDITISSEAKVSITASKDVHIIASNQVVIGTEDAYLELTENTATLAAGEVLIN